MIVHVYKATSPSGKCYIGITSDLNRRKRDHIYKAFDTNSYKSNYRFKKAINKYGSDNISWQIIDNAKDYDTARELERRYVLHFNSHSNGYNMTSGGDHCNSTPKKWTKEATLKESKKYKTRNEWKKKSKGSYDAARRYKKYDIEFYNKCCSHLKTIFRSYTFEDIRLSASKYTHSKQWKNNDGRLWSAADKYRKNYPEIYKEITSHFTVKRREPWSEEDIINEAAKYNTRSEWKRYSESSYKKALDDKNFFERCVEHMRVKKHDETIQEKDKHHKQHQR